MVAEVMATGVRFLAGDIGGTNTRLLLFESTRDELRPNRECPGRLIASKQYVNREHPSLMEVVRLFLGEFGGLDPPPRTACLAVAGPVNQNRVVFTNRPDWNMAGGDMMEKLGIERVQLVNDFLANGYGLLTLDHDTDCLCIQPAEATPGAPIVCIGAGTGLGECFLTVGPDGEYTCYPSEGGHSEFAPRNPVEFELLQALMEKFQEKHRVSVERVVSGTGLANVYEFLEEKYPDEVDPAVSEAFHARDADKGFVVATNTSNSLCQRTMEVFSAAYGSEAGVACLKWMPFGGLYLTGGLTPKNIQWIDCDIFRHAFKDKGRVKGLIDNVPVYAVMVEDLGQRGAKLFAYKMLRELMEREVNPDAQEVAPPAAAVGGPSTLTLAAAVTATLAVGVGLGMMVARRMLSPAV